MHRRVFPALLSHPSLRCLPPIRRHAVMRVHVKSSWTTRSKGLQLERSLRSNALNRLYDYFLVISPSDRKARPGLPKGKPCAWRWWPSWRLHARRWRHCARTAVHSHHLRFVPLLLVLWMWPAPLACVPFLSRVNRIALDFVRRQEAD